MAARVWDADYIASQVQLGDLWLTHPNGPALCSQTFPSIVWSPIEQPLTLGSTIPTPKVLGELWADTSTLALKQCTVLNPPTYVAVGGGGSGTPSDTVGALTGTGSAGVSTTYSRGDHIHGDTNRPTDAQTAALVGTSGSPGAGNKYVTDADSRNTNARTPTAHTHPESDVTSLVTDLAGKAASSHTHAESDVTSLTTDLAAKEATANKGVASGYASLDSGTKVPIAQLPTGSTSSTVCIGNDSRLSDARTPLAHGSTHQLGGTDPVINAYAPGSVTIPTGQYVVGLKRIDLSSTQRLDMAGTAQLYLTSSF